jgi:multiple sugar transport system substrate-binding protein
MYFGGFVEPINDIDPSFKLDPDVYTLGDTVYFDAAKKVMAPTGKLMSVPISPLIPLLYYRGDLYKEAGLKAPETFTELEANAKKLHKPPGRYGIVQRGARGPATVSYDFYPYLYGFGGSIYKNQAAGDYSVTLNNEAGLTALQYYLMLAKECGHPQTASLEQAEVIQNMATGKAAHIMAVISAWSQVDDPDKSAVIDKVEFAPTPHAPGFSTGSGLGHWLGGIAKNIPDDRKRGALEFLRWFQTRDAQLANARFGGIPINAASYRDPISQERKFRWMKPLADSLQHAVSVYQFPESSEVIAILELGLNQAVARNVEAPAALNDMADKIHGVMTKYGYQTAKLPPLR